MYRLGRHEAKMADIDFDDFDVGYSVGPAVLVRRYDRMMHLAGAAASAALLIGAVWWGYELAVRDVTGVPVMRAVDGAMRVAPANPGGNIAGHQGLSVNAVAAAGTAVPLPDQLFLAPAAQTLAEEDAAGMAQPVVATSAAPEETLPLFETGFFAPTQLIATEIPSTDQDAVAAALAAALGATETVAPEPTLIDANGITRSLRPQPRPAVQRSGTAPASALSAEPLGAATAVVPPTLVATSQTWAEVDPSSITVGTRMVQLGAFDDASAAKSDWTRLAGRFTELLADKSLVVQPAQSGGRTFYRLRAVGFADESEARRFCTALLAENATCIPVSQR
jgi:hypothetical protein